jgi:hypothetical protein
MAEDRGADGPPYEADEVGETASSIVVSDAI